MTTCTVLMMYAARELALTLICSSNSASTFSSASASGDSPSFRRFSSRSAISSGFARKTFCTSVTSRSSDASSTTCEAHMCIACIATSTLTERRAPGVQVNASAGAIAPSWAACSAGVSLELAVCSASARENSSVCPWLASSHACITEASEPNRAFFLSPRSLRPGNTGF